MGIIGNPAPNFSAPAAKDGEEITLSLEDFKGKWLILLFYPLDFTFVCPTELVAFSDAADQFKAVNAEIVGVSVDSVHTHLAWMRTPRSQAGVGELNYPLLSDLSKEIAAAYDVLNDDQDINQEEALARARAIVKDPKVLLLDEATSAINPDEEAALYAGVARMGTTMLSIAHRLELRKFHTRELKVKGDGTGAWEVEELC